MSTLEFPFLNSVMILFLYSWSIPLCIEDTVKLSSIIFLASQSTFFLELQKITAWVIVRLSQRSQRVQNFHYSLSTETKYCLMPQRVSSSLLTRILMGFFMNLVVMFRIYWGRVALTITDWHSWGRYWQMSQTCYLNPRASISSASSRISIFIREVLRNFFWIISYTLPGVPLIMWTPASKASISFSLGIPPKQACTWIFISDPKAKATFCVCSANSLIGDSIRTCGDLSLISTRCSAPKQNTAVFPVPDWLCTITSLPEMSGMMDRC